MYVLVQKVLLLYVPCLLARLCTVHTVLWRLATARLSYGAVFESPKPRNAAMAHTLSVTDPQREVLPFPCRAERDGPTEK